MAYKKKEWSTEDARNFFRKLVKSGPWAPVYLLMGSEHFLLADAVSRLLQASFPEGPDDFNYNEYDAREDKATDVISACETLPMFADKRVVRVRNVDTWKVEDLNKVAEYVEHPATTTLLILEAESLPKRSGAAKKIHAAKQVAKMGFEPMDSAEVIQWIEKRQSRKYFLRISRAVATDMVEFMGESLEPIDHALEKLMLFTGATRESPQTIHKKTLDDVIVDARMRSVFELTDALTQRDCALSIQTYRNMILHGGSPLGSISMIAREFRGMLLSANGTQRGIAEADIAKLIGAPPWTVKKYLQKSRRFSELELQEIIKSTTATASKLTSSRLHDDLHMEQLIVQICHPR